MSASPYSLTGLLQLVQTVPDFPRPGIVFRDLTPLFATPTALRMLVEELVERCRPMACEVIVGIEARGFLVGTAMAYGMGVGFVPVRKPGKLGYKPPKVKPHDLRLCWTSTRARPK